MNNNVERFLADAEKYARNGERELAYSLLELALLNAPNESWILSRVEEIRALMSSGVLRDESVQTVELPELPSFTLDSQEDVLEEDVDDARDMYWDCQLEPVATLKDEHDVDNEEEHPRRKIHILSLAFLVVAVLAAGVYIVNPQGVLNLIYYRQVAHPVDKAKELHSSGNIESAVSQLGLVASTDKRALEALLLKAEILSAANDTTRAEQAWQEIVLHPRVTWRELLEAARWYFDKGDVEAKVLYMLAFERGAPREYWMEIAKAQALQGDTRAAASIYQLILRKFPADSMAAATELKKLQKMSS